MTSTLALYLHGFASGPKSEKALFFAKKLNERGIETIIPDLNEPSFSDLTLSRQIMQVQNILNSQTGKRVVLFGSSMGGLVATMVAERQAPGVVALVLLAPGFGLNRRWEQLMPPAEWESWQNTGVREVFHHATGKNAQLKYEFILNARQHETGDLRTTVPALVFHGIHDDVVPVEESRLFKRNNPELVEFIEMDSDHGLLDKQPEMWEHTDAFLRRLEIA